MLRIHQALCDFLRERFPGIVVEKVLVLDLPLDDWDEQPRIVVAPGESSSGRVEKPGQMVNTARGAWRENHNFDVTFCSRFDDERGAVMAAARAAEIFPLFRRLILPAAEAVCTGADKPRPYSRRNIEETNFFIAPHVVAFRRDYVEGQT